ncbi:MAG: hypothetical protein HON13_02550 [Candidatus Thioglobus sp.]|nr:hypothetical protein [Candidatus Thioglobus sp.]
MKTKQTYALVLFFTIGFFNHSVFANLPSSSKPLQQVSQAMEDNKFKKIEEKLKQIIEQSPSKHAYVELASLYLSQNKNKEAIRNYQEATLLDPTDSKLFTSMSIAYLHLGFYDASKAMAEQALTLEPTLTHAGKIVQYIDKKKEVLAKAAKAGKTDKEVD